MNSAPRQTSGLGVGRVGLVASAFNMMPLASEEAKVDAQSTATLSFDYNVVSTDVIVQGDAPDGAFVKRLDVEVVARFDHGAVLCKAKCCYQGSFIWSEPSDITLEQAKGATACAILYGFAREHIADLMRRALSPTPMPVILPPMNFSQETEDHVDPSMPGADD